MSGKREKLASFGIATKGVVYLIIGVLTAMAAFGMGGQKSNSGTVLEFLEKQSFGNVLLVLLAIGLIGYVFWRWYQAFANPKNLDDDLKGSVKRVSYFISGLLYGFLAYSAIKLVVSSSSSNSSLSQKIFESDYAMAFAIIIGLALIGKGIYEIYRAYSGKFKEDVQSAQLDHKAESLVLKAGRVGYTARGIVAGILGFLFLKVAYTETFEKLSKTDVFSFIEQEFGSIVMGIVALGLAAYGVFMIIKSRYSSISVRKA